MAYDETRNRLPRATPRTDAPAVDGYMLTAAMITDADLAIYAKSLRIYNGSSAAVVVAVTPMRAADDATKLAYTIGAGDKETIPLAVRRIWSTGSTGLVAGISAGTVEVQIYTA